MSTKLPESIERFEDSYPAVWDSFMQLGDQCHKAGPLDEKTWRLVKIALAIGASLEGGAHSAVRNAKAAGVTVDEMRHVAVLSITTLGLPAGSLRHTAVVSGLKIVPANEQPSNSR
ncbi:MAG TPA: carboxymuconolactone decarboxylase family protein [Pyrinomonadaceae bacterium]|jgi:alkylhydroperoxidase/carboxymuconolactone decarboxylase family protein YurZ